MNIKTDLFETVPIPKAVMRFSLPMVLGMLVTVVYIVVDTFFVAQTGDPNQVAAVTICMPVFMLCMALGNLFGVGGASYISRLLGEKEYAKAKRTSAFAFYASAALGLLAAIALFASMNTILPMIGTTPLTETFSRQYLQWIAAGAPFIVLSFAMGQLVRSVGAAKEAMIGMVAGTLLNIVLDPIMILVLDMGVVGAAVATVIANVVSVIYFIAVIAVKGYGLSIHPRDFALNGTIVRSVLAIGIPSTLAELLMSAAGVVFNFFGARHGEAFLAAFGIANVVIMMPVMIVMGLSRGIQPLIGYTYTAGLHKRLRAALKFTFFVGTAVALLLTTAVYLFGKEVVSVFMDEPSVATQGWYIIRRIAWSMPIFGALFVPTMVFQALGKARQAMILSIARQGIVYLPILLTFNYAFGRDGLIFAFPAADTLSALLGIILFLPVLKELKSNRQST